MNRLGKYRSKILDRVSTPESPTPPPALEARSGPFALRRCACGRLSWDEYSNHCLFGHKASGEHRRLGKHEVAA